LADQAFQHEDQGAASQNRGYALHTYSFLLMLLERELKRRQKAAQQEQDDGNNSNAPLQEHIGGQPLEVSPSNTSADIVILD
jgi:hypothetical protein